MKNQLAISGGALEGLALPFRPATDLLSLVGKVVGIILLVAGIIAFLYLLYGGIQYMTAGGDAEKATAARTTILNSVIGVVIIVIAYAVVTYVVGIF
ncbi:MAG: hypothetical protein COX39_01165, partial [Candidatus Nealsonbacteria bacterium CG23_combo_of_CG06-09_8_20_14_all_40_13]